MRSLSSLTDQEKNTFRRLRQALKIQTANGMVTSDTHAKLYDRELGTFLWIYVVENSPSVLSLLRTEMDHMERKFCLKKPEARIRKSVPKTSGIITCSPIIRRTPSEKSAKWQWLRAPDVKDGLSIVWMALWLRQILVTWSLQIIQFWTWKIQSRCEHSNALIVQDEFTNWIHCYPMKTKKDSSETMACMKRFPPPSRQPERFVETFQKDWWQFFFFLDLQYGHDTSTLHRWETNKVEERTVRRVKEGTSLTLVQGGLPDVRWEREGMLLQLAQRPR